MNLNKPPTLLQLVFHSNVHKVHWGPLNDYDKDFVLFAYAEGIIVSYNTNRPLEDPKFLENAEFVTDFAWNSNYKLLAVSTKIGSIILYNDNLTLLANLYLQHKPISKIVWHPSMMFEVDGNSTINYENWLALYTNEKSVYVYNISLDLLKGSLIKAFFLQFAFLMYSKNECFYKY